jgi:hypothetical protein
MYNAPKLLEGERDDDKIENIKSIQEKSQVMFGLIKEFNSNINEILLETNSDETIEDYSNKITSFFENQRNTAIDAIKNYPISEEMQNLANKKAIEDAEFESEKIRHQTKAELIVATAELNARQESHNMSQQEWKMFYDESKLVSDGIFNFTSTFINPIFEGINSIFNNLFNKSIYGLILILCFGALWTGLPNAIFRRIKRALERDTQQPIAIQNQPQREVREPEREVREPREEMNEEELRYFREWRRDLREEDREEEDRREEEEEDRRRRRGRRRGGTMKLKNKTKKNKRITRNKTKKNKRMNKKNKKTKRHNKK